MTPQLRRLLGLALSLLLVVAGCAMVLVATYALFGGWACLGVAGAGLVAAGLVGVPT